MFPFLFLLAYETFVSKTSKGDIFKKFLSIGLGFTVPIIIYFGFLLYNNAINELISQQTVQISLYEETRSLPFLFLVFLKNIFLARTCALTDSRSYFYTMVFFLNAFMFLYFLKKTLLQKQALNRHENIIAAICVFSLFGYMDSFHMYEILRLNNGASLGVGIFIYLYIKVFRSWKTGFRFALLLPLCVLCCVFMNSLIFKRTSSAYIPWNPDILKGKGVSTTEIGVFRGKLLAKSYCDFYNEILQKISENDPSYYIVNFTRDAIAVIINDRKRVQILPYYFPKLSYACTGESEKIQKMIDQKKAVILSAEDLKIPGYKVIFNRPFPKEIEYCQDRLYISVPDIK
ncbi:MAG: hypothetical protein A2Z72_04235 [Omnitrophica bacterium RBG_13_46_9]|nr:MAG: hypothetical protein A2Z72_04235 [Omnitrophica bacterium RBG_13_46_9]